MMLQHFLRRHSSEIITDKSERGSLIRFTKSVDAELVVSGRMVIADSGNGCSVASLAPY
ncbi:MAG: hypothetical protein AAAB35_27685 [Phyllobacterium sp.]|uniref:hypothetical protein n=1 Tax=Phyllobacterium sp. TaxID=1871046 RepID=UPI0030F1F654